MYIKHEKPSLRMLRRPFALVAILILLVQPAMLLAGESGPGTEDRGAPPGRDAGNRVSADIAAEEMALREPCPAFLPLQPEEPMFSHPCPSMPGQFVAGPAMAQLPILEPLPAPTFPMASLSDDRQPSPIVHRGELDLAAIRPALSSPMLA